MTTFRYNGQRIKNLPRACSYCGRGDHKVVLQHADNTREGLCPGCFADGLAVEARRTHWIEKGVTVYQDNRGTRSKNQAPVPEELQPQRTPREEQLPAEEPSHVANGRRVWTACGHPAERDVMDGCYTCQRPLVPLA